MSIVEIRFSNLTIFFWIGPHDDKILVTAAKFSEYDRG